MSAASYVTIFIHQKWMVASKVKEVITE